MRSLAVLTAAFLAATPVHAQERVVVVGGALTEIVVALGESHRMIGRDTTSTWPEEIQELPDVGYMRALSPEGLLSLDPDLILADAGSGPQETIDIMQAAQVPFVQVQAAYSAEGVLDRITAVSEALGVDGSAFHDEVAAEFEALAAAREARAARAEPLRVMFIISAQGGRINASGAGTAAAGIIDLAGAVNAVEGYEGYRQLNDEAITAAAPDAIVMMDRAGDFAIDDSEILAHPALGLTPAARDGRVIRMDGLFLLGFGPRTPQAARELMERLGD